MFESTIQAEKLFYKNGIHSLQDLTAMRHGVTRKRRKKLNGNNKAV